VKKVQKTLRETQALLNAALNNSQVGIAIADAPGGQLKYVNDAGLLICGSDRKTVVEGIGIDQYVASWQLMNLDGRPLQSDEVPLTRAILFGETCTKEFLIRRTADDDRHVLAKAAPIRDENCKVTAGIDVFMDVTDEKKIEAALQSALEEIRTLRGIIPICANCKKIRDDRGFWNHVEAYISDRTEAKFSHGICPDCVKILYPDLDLDDESTPAKKEGP
jgi:PAS domain S-box-containing protein